MLVRDVERGAVVLKVIQNVCNRGGASVPTFLSEAYSASLAFLFSFVGASSLDCGGTLTWLAAMLWFFLEYFQIQLFICGTNLQPSTSFVSEIERL